MKTACDTWKANAHRVLAEKSEDRRPVVRAMRRWKDSIGIDFKETRWEGLGWIYPARDRDN
jgi:hypothetical protein